MKNKYGQTVAPAVTISSPGVGRYVITTGDPTAQKIKDLKRCISKLAEIARDMSARVLARQKSQLAYLEGTV